MWVLSFATTSLTRGLHRCKTHDTDSLGVRKPTLPEPEPVVGGKDEVSVTPTPWPKVGCVQVRLPMLFVVDVEALRGELFVTPHQRYLCCC